MIDNTTRDLILAAEIAGYLHDLGKAHTGFAEEMLQGGQHLGKCCNIDQAHGAILEPGNPYHTDQSPQWPVLENLRQHPRWAKHLELPEAWIAPNTVQAHGLGDPLRQHHAGRTFPESELTLLGDLYAFGADVRDSALDKGSGKVRGSRQPRDGAFISDTFGRRAQPYGPQPLQAIWGQAISLIEAVLFKDANRPVPELRRRLLEGLEPLFRNALGETRRPTNDVTLHHHAYSTASLFKAAVAEGVLRGDFKRLQDHKGLFDFERMGQVRFRLLGIRWNWNALTRDLLSPVAMTSLSLRRREVLEQLRNLFEDEFPVGNVIYEDDDGVLMLLPGFQEKDPEASETLFDRLILEPLLPRIDPIIALLGTGTPYRLHWSAPRLYLTDYREALGLVPQSPRIRHLQADEAGLKALWQEANADSHLNHVCPQCGLRPARVREQGLAEAGKEAQPLCHDCKTLQSDAAKRERWQTFGQDFGFTPATLDLETMAQHRSSPRIALVSVQVDTGAIASGNALITQLARPLNKIDLKRCPPDLNAAGDLFDQTLGALRQGRNPKGRDDLCVLLGDSYWLKPNDGRGSPLEVAEDFFLRESAHLPQGWGLVRHDGDRLALFAVRKHPSPARLQRLWDDLRETWRDLVQRWGTQLSGDLIPLSQDAAGVRFAVAAADVDTVVRDIADTLPERFAAVRGGLAAHVSVVVSRPRFPLYLALDALQHLEARVRQMPLQRWTLLQRAPDLDGRHRLSWETSQGSVVWRIPDDPYHAHVILDERQGQKVLGPARLTHISALQQGDVVLVPPMSFDFTVLEGGARRHQLHYRLSGDRLLRPHWVMEEGCAPLHLESFADFSNLVTNTGWEISKLKQLQEEMIATYERWVRDVPAPLKAQGRQAWRLHLSHILRRYLQNDLTPQALLPAIEDGRFFQAVEWSTFVKKSTQGDIDAKPAPSALRP